MLSDPHFRKLLPEIIATIRFRTVMKKKFNTMMLSTDIRIGSGRLSGSNEIMRPIKTIIVIKPAFKRVSIFSNRQKSC